MKRDTLIALLILLLAAGYFAAPQRKPTVLRVLDWWDRWAMEARPNWLPNERGLNIAVLDKGGKLVEQAAFDTYLQADSGFALFVAALPAERWAIVAVRDEAATSLSDADLAALESLGGSRVLAGKHHWSYVLVGWPGLAPGAAVEQAAPGALDVRLTAGTAVGGRPLPTALRVRSAGYEAGSYAALTTDGMGYANFWQWLQAALERA